MENTAVFREVMIGGIGVGMIRVGNDLSQMVYHSGSELAAILLLQGQMSRLVEAEPAGLKPWVCAEGSRPLQHSVHTHVVYVCTHAYIRVCVHIPA